MVIDLSDGFPLLASILLRRSGRPGGVVVMLDCDTAKRVKTYLAERETITDFIQLAVARECEERDQLRARGDLPDNDEATE
jgi:hypothetical protein